METRPIGSLSASVIGLGCNNFGRKIDYDASVAVVDAALDCGITYFDTADRYGYGPQPYSAFGRSEEYLGKALGSRRESVVISTKFGHPMSDDPLDRGASRQWILRACEDSLRRLGTDYLDIYRIHTPDFDTPIEETLGALTELVDAGKVREISCCNFGAEMLEEASDASAEHGHRRFASAMGEYSMLVRRAERDELPWCEQNDIPYLPYFPLASGLLTGKYSPDRPAPEGSRLAMWTARPHFELDAVDFPLLERLERFAVERGHTLGELAIAWLAAKPVIASVIAGATSPEQVRENAAAAAWRLTNGELAEIEGLYQAAAA
jgi:aryl-alcohol dehydrogenase-like predicted oxidoreductase